MLVKLHMILYQVLVLPVERNWKTLQDFWTATEVTGGLENVVYEEKVKEFWLLNLHNRTLGGI